MAVKESMAYFSCCPQALDWAARMRCSAFVYAVVVDSDLQLRMAVRCAVPSVSTGYSTNSMRKPR